MNKDSRRRIWRAAGTAAAVVTVFCSAPVSALAADLKPETLQEWDEYVKAVDERNREHLAPGASFLASDQNQEQLGKLRAGQIIVWPASRQVPVKVNSGLVHDWIGAAWIPNTTLREIFPVVRDYNDYKHFYGPNIIESKRIASSGSEDKFCMVIMNRSVVAKTALDSDYQSTYTRVDEHRWYSISDATRIQEIADCETPRNTCCQKTTEPA